MHPIFSLLVASLAVSQIPSAAAQDIVYDSIHNVTSLLGTWSSGSGNVRTGVVSLSSSLAGVLDGSPCMAMAGCDITWTAD